MRKVINPGKTLAYGKTGKKFPHNVFIEITFENKRLSLHGVVGPWSNGDAAGGCGQIQDELNNLAEYSDGWDKDLVSRLADVWAKWHLNDLQAGCEHQRKMKWDEIRIDPAELPESNANRDEKGILAMWVYPKDHPKGILTKPCLICGYKYGTSWLHEDVPDSVIKFLESLPETKIKYAWV